MNMGIIAEDDSDVSVLRELTSKLLRPHRVGFKKFIGHGSGKLRRKCGAWAKILVDQGCRWIVVVHDLDRGEERVLRPELSAAVEPARARCAVILIPKQEIEAWLLYDANAIAAAFNEGRGPRLPGNPESLPDPKRYLTGLIRRTYQKDYINTLHNHIIAKHMDISLLRPSRSFALHPPFVRAVRESLSR